MDSWKELIDKREDSDMRRKLTKSSDKQPLEQEGWEVVKTLPLILNQNLVDHFKSSKGDDSPTLRSIVVLNREDRRFEVVIDYYATYTGRACIVDKENMVWVINNQAIQLSGEIVRIWRRTPS